MAGGKRASVSLPIQPGQLSTAPATIPFFHYDENSGQWLEDGTLIRVNGTQGYVEVLGDETTKRGKRAVRAIR